MNIKIINNKLNIHNETTIQNIDYSEKYDIGFIVSKDTFNKIEQLQKIKIKDQFNKDPGNLLNGEIYSLSCWIYALMDSKLKYKLIKLSDDMMIYKAKMCKNIVFYFTYSKDLYNKLIENNDILKYFNYSYFEKKNNKDDINILTTYYNNNYNIPLGIYPHPICKKKNNINFNNNIYGLIWSKCVSHWVDNKNTDNVLNCIKCMGKKNIFLYTTLRNIKNIKFPNYLNKEIKHIYYDIYNQINNCNNINNLQQTNMTTFRELLKHVKFIIGFETHGSGPTIVECLHTKTLLLCPSKQIPIDLQKNKNIILTDNMSSLDISNIIINIIEGKIKFDNSYIPFRYTYEGVKNSLYNIFSTITEKKINIIKNKDIGICYLSWKSHNRLIETLENHKNSSLYKFINDKYIFFQEISDKDIKIKDKYNLKYFKSSINLGIYYGFKVLVENCKNKYMIFCENDFLIRENEKFLYNIFEDCIDLFENNNADIIRLRDMVEPGYPLYSRGYIKKIKYTEYLFNKKSYSKKFNYILESLNWLEYPQSVFNNLNIIDKKHKWVYTKQKNTNWTNNIFIAKTTTLLNIILPLFNNIKKNDLNKDIHLNMEYFLDNLDSYLDHNTYNLKKNYNDLNIFSTRNNLFYHLSKNKN